jgi:nicotinamidase-related amidase
MTDYTSPDYDRAALITIDVQSDTLDGQPLEIPGTTSALPRMVRLANAFRARGRPIFHVVRIYRRDGTNVDLCRRAVVEQGADMLIEGSPGCELAAALRPGKGACLDPALLLQGHLQAWGDNEFVVYKPRWGAFFETPLMAALEQRGVSTLVFVGCNFPNCPRTSIYQASERDFRVAVAADALSGLDAAGTQQLEAIGVAVRPTNAIVDAVMAPTTSLQSPLVPE